VLPDKAVEKARHFGVFAPENASAGRPTAGQKPRPYKADSKSKRYWAVSPVLNALAKRSVSVPGRIVFQRAAGLPPGVFS
jgi:hypothetical protein